MQLFAFLLLRNITSLFLKKFLLLFFPCEFVLWIHTALRNQSFVFNWLLFYKSSLVEHNQSTVIWLCFCTCKGEGENITFFCLTDWIFFCPNSSFDTAFLGPKRWANKPHFFALLHLWDIHASYKSQGSNHSVLFIFCLKFKLESGEDKFNLLSFFRVIMNTHESDAYTVSPELPAMFDGMKLAAVATVLYVIVRCLNLKSPTAPPDLTYQDTPLSRFLLKSCPQLTKEWVFLSMFFHVGITLKMFVCWRGRCCLSGGGSAPFCYFAQCSTYLYRNY